MRWLIGALALLASTAWATPPWELPWDKNPAAAEAMNACQRLQDGKTAACQITFFADYAQVFVVAVGTADTQTAFAAGKVIALTLCPMVDVRYGFTAKPDSVDIWGCNQEDATKFFLVVAGMPRPMAGP